MANDTHHRKNLTDAFIKAIKPTGERVEYLDEGYTGRGSLYLRVGSKGRKTWTFLYRFNGKIHRSQIGVYPEMSLVQARRRAGEMILSIDAGKNPNQATTETVPTRIKQGQGRSPFGNLAERYIQQYAMVHKKSWREDERILKHDVLPFWADRETDQISRRDVVALLDGMQEHGVTVGANRALAVIRKIYNWAIDRGELTNNPAFKLKAPAKENAKDRVLTDSEIINFWKGLDNTGISNSVKWALRFMLVTGQRLGEVRQMQFSQVDGNIWTIPAAVAKNGRTHRVPLSEIALDICEDAIEGYDGDIVFRSPRNGGLLSDTALSHAMRDSLAMLGIDPATPHDLRRTSASHMTMLGFNRVIVSKILNHAEGGVTSVYDRYGYEKEKADALEAWGQKLIKMIGIDLRFDLGNAIQNYVRPKYIRKYSMRHIKR